MDQQRLPHTSTNNQYTPATGVPSPNETTRMDGFDAFEEIHEYIQTSPNYKVHPLDWEVQTFGGELYSLYGAFDSDVKSKVTELVVGGGVLEIVESAFFGCRQLVSVSFERGLECLRDSAFAGCESLTQVTLPWGTGAVGRMAFFGCTRLSFVKMPTTTRVSDFAFDGCAPGIRVFGGVYAGRMAANPAGE